MSRRVGWNEEEWVRRVVSEIDGLIENYPGLDSVLAILTGLRDIMEDHIPEDDSQAEEWERTIRLIDDTVEEIESGEL